MSNLNTLMSRATVDVVAFPSTAVLDADVSRGQRARRRRNRLAGTGVAGAFALTAAVGVGFTTSAAPAAAVGLVAYTGQQPVGFTIEEIPDGWHVVHSDADRLLLGDGDDDDTEPDSFKGRIAAILIGTESLPTTLEPRTFTVDGEDAHVYELVGKGNTPNGTLGVVVPEGEGTYLYVQLPSDLGWTHEVAAQFASGLDVTSDAQMSHG